MESERNRTTIIIVKTEYLCGQGMRGGVGGVGDRPAGCHSRSRRLHRVERRGAPGNERNGKIGEERERERATPRKTDPRKGEKVGKGGGRKIGGRTLSCSPFERERKRESGRGRDIRESFAELRGAPFGVPLCSL